LTRRKNRAIRRKLLQQPQPASTSLGGLRISGPSPNEPRRVVTG
jgi:hypothetical protein